MVPSGYVFLVNNYCTFKSSVQTINHTHQSWYPRSKFIVCFYGQRGKNLSSSERLLIVKEVASILKKYNVFDFVVLIPSYRYNKSQPDVEIYSWFPFSSTNRCADVNQLNLIDTWIGGRRFQNDGGAINLFAKKIPTKFDAATHSPRCKIKITSFHWPPATLIDSGRLVDGYNYLAIRLMADFRNLQLEFVPLQKKTRWGIMFRNGTWNGILGEVSKGRADVAFGGALQTLNRYMMYDMSVTFQSTYFKFYVPPPLKLPHWRNMIDIFSIWFWLTIGLVNTLVCLVVCAFSSLKMTRTRENPIFRNVLDCVFVLWPAMIGTSSNPIPRSTAVRIVFVTWLIYNLHITLVYTSSLLGFITRPNYEKPIDTIRQLRLSDLKVLIIAQFEPIYVLAADEDEDMKMIMSRVHHYNSYSDDIATMLIQRNVSIFVPSDHYAYYAGRNRTEIHTIPQDVIRFNTAMYLQKGSVYLEAINHAQIVAFESGLQQKRMNDLSFGLLRDNHYQSLTSTPPAEYEHALLSLTLHELQGSFYLLIFGLTTSILVFFAELIYKTYRTRLFELQHYRQRKNNRGKYFSRKP